MARSQETVTCKPDTWTELTNSDVTAITFQGELAIEVRGTVGAVPPITGGGLLYKGELGEGNTTLTDLWSDALITRVYAKPVGTVPVKVLVDHA